MLNWFYQGGALDTYGLDVGYFITPDLNASVGYYYQSGDLGTADGSGVLGRVAYDISNGLTAGVNLSYDEAFETRVSADLKVRFGGANTTAQRKEVQQLPVISALTTSPGNRDVKVHDAFTAVELLVVLGLAASASVLEEAVCNDELTKVQKELVKTNPSFQKFKNTSFGKKFSTASCPSN